MAGVLTNDGEGHVIDQLDAFGTHYIGQGTGTTPAAKGDTDLETPSAEARSGTTDTQPTADVLHMEATITSLSTQAITEMGVFDASTSGNLIIHDVFTAINVNADDSITFKVDWEAT
jgi:hypothetical protein